MTFIKHKKLFGNSRLLPCPSRGLCKCIASYSELNVLISRLPTFLSSLFVIHYCAWQKQVFYKRLLFYSMCVDHVGAGEFTIHFSPGDRGLYLPSLAKKVNAPLMPEGGGGGGFK